MYVERRLEGVRVGVILAVVMSYIVVLGMICRRRLDLVEKEECERRYLCFFFDYMLKFVR